jgi:hypothetical protein
MPRGSETFCNAFCSTCRRFEAVRDQKALLGLLPLRGCLQRDSLIAAMRIKDGTTHTRSPHTPLLSTSFLPINCHLCFPLTFGIQQEGNLVRSVGNSKLKGLQSAVSAPMRHHAYKMRTATAADRCRHALVSFFLSSPGRPAHASRALPPCANLFRHQLCLPPALCSSRGWEAARTAQSRSFR